jgi:hypothetical protein
MSFDTNPMNDEPADREEYERWERGQAKPIATVGMEITIGNPWWRKGVPTLCVIREVHTCSPYVTVQPREGHPHARYVKCEDAGVRWPGKPQTTDKSDPTEAR